MRVALPGVARSGDGFGFRFDGRDCVGFPGESLAAALVTGGHMALSTTARGDGRGVFCGMGVCGECTVRVDGQTRRACMMAAAPGLVVEAMPARAEPAPPAALPAAQALACDVLVIGGGPAGLAAVQALAATGLDVVVIDERSRPGGQYFKQPGAGFAVDPARLDAQFGEGRALIAAVAASGARVLAGTLAWAAEAAGDQVAVHAQGPDGPLRITARRLIIAMGAAERPWPMPGWTLPGVMTTGAAQTLLRSGAVAPGRRVLVAGNGPLNIQLACELLAAGIDVAGLVEQAPWPFTRPAAALAMARHDAALALAGIGQLARLARAGVPLLFGHALIAAQGDGRVQRAVAARLTAGGLAGERAFAVDALCIGAGFQPQAELARALGCALGWHDGAAVVVRDDDGRTSQRHVFVAGDGGGLGGARAALAQGALAGLAAAADLGAAADAARVRQLQRQLATARGFQAGLWRLFAPAHAAPSVATAQTMICRCEGVTFGAVDALIADGPADAGRIKRATRLGMGRCQGRYCAPLLANRLAAAAGRPAAADDLYAPRPPFKPISIAALAAAADPP